MIDMRTWEKIAAKSIHNRPSAPGRMKGKIAVITGAAQGFGQGIAEEMYKEGAAVVIADINLPLAQEVAAALGERAAAVQVNVNGEAVAIGDVNVKQLHFACIFYIRDVKICFHNLLLIMLGDFIQLFVAEIEQEIGKDHNEVQYIEEQNVPF